MQSLGKAVSCNVSIKNNSAVFYADDTIAETDTTFSNGTITLTVDDDGDTVFAPLLGHEIDSVSGVMIRNKNDVPPYVGVGRIINKIKNGKAFQSRISLKGKIRRAFLRNHTHGETTEFGTQQIEGTIAAL